MKSPCKGCDHRMVFPNCHITCIEYLKFAAEREQIRLERKRERTCSKQYCWRDRKPKGR